MRPNLINRLKEEWNNLDPVDPLRGLIADAIDALAEQQKQGCEYCNNALYAGTKCKNCGRVTEQAAIKRDLTPEQPAQQQEPVAWGNFKEDGTLVGLSQHPEDQANWTGRKPLYTSPPAQPKYRRGDRLICLETEEYCVIHISGTDRQWVKFPDTHIGVYKNEQLAELFELLPKEIEIEQPAQQEPVAYAVYHRMGGSKSLHWPEQHSPDGDASQYQLLPLYTSPPASKPWVGLTQQDIDIAFDDTQEGGGFNEFARAIEAKLKEKNT